MPKVTNNIKSVHWDVYNIFTIWICNTTCATEKESSNISDHVYFNLLPVAWSLWSVAVFPNHRRSRNTSWFLRHHFAVMMSLYLLLLIFIGTFNSNTFTSFWNRRFSWPNARILTRSSPTVPSSLWPEASAPWLHILIRFVSRCHHQQKKAVRCVTTQVLKNNNNLRLEHVASWLYFFFSTPSHSHRNTVDLFKSNSPGVVSNRFWKNIPAV